LDIDPHTVSPGKTARISVIWDAQASGDKLAARAAIQTNDPAHPAIDFDLTGQARITLAAEPPVLRAPRIKPSESPSLETVVVSPEWDAFALEAEPSLSGIDCAVHPLERTDLGRLQVKSGWRLVVTLPADLPAGPLNERIYLTARPAASGGAASSPSATSDEIVQREILIEGSVLGRLTVYGKDLNEMGNIEVGTLDEGKGFETTLTIKVSDADPMLKVSEVTTIPNYIQAQLDALPDRGIPGMYRLHVRIPPGRRAASYLGQNRGKLAISFDHPRIEQLNLGVEFVVLTSSTNHSMRAGADGPTSLSVPPNERP
jgi:hypothetical protein